MNHPAPADPASNSKHLPDSVTSFSTAMGNGNVRPSLAAGAAQHFELQYFYLSLIGRDEAREIAQGLVQVRTTPGIHITKSTIRMNQFSMSMYEVRVRWWQ